MRGSVVDPFPGNAPGHGIQRQKLMKRNSNHTILALATATLAAFAPCGAAIAAGEIPATLPKPDGKPGETNKPVKVYILAGQSNMVGMGELGGSKNMYTGVFLTSDPAVATGPLDIFKVGKSKISTLATFLPDGTPTEKAVAEGLLEVPETGTYQAHCGYGEGSYNTMEIDGKKAYSRQPNGNPVKADLTLQPGKRYPFKISGFKGDPPRFWMQKMDLLGHGDLEAVTKREGKFPNLIDEKGDWSVRNDVYFYDARIKFAGSPLSATSNGKTIGPELGFGHVLGTFHDEQVLLIKTAMGNRALGFDFRPPSSGRNDPASEWESLEYKLMIEGVHKTLDQIDKIVPGYKGQGYEIAGFAWWQGHKDSGTPESQAGYEKNLVNLINDVRKEFKLPNLPAVVATIGFGGYHMPEQFLKIFDAQMAVADPKKHPEYAGTIATVDTRDFWRDVDDSPTNQDYHYNRNAETYALTGDAMGRAMVRLLGGKAETPRLAAMPPTEDKTAIAASPSREKPELAPIVVDGIVPAYVANPKNNKTLVGEAQGEKPARPNQFLQGALDGLVNCYDSVGIHEYDWHTFGPDLRDAQWDYFSFDPEETLPKEKGARYRKVTYPDGMDNWVTTGFDAAKAGWKSGRPPFGQLDGKLEPLAGCERGSECGCGEKPNTLWEKEVLMVRGTFEFPALKATATASSSAAATMSTPARATRSTSMASCWQSRRMVSENARVANPGAVTFSASSATNSRAAR
jgi:hypothetical protein